MLSAIELESARDATVAELVHRVDSSVVVKGVELATVQAFVVRASRVTIAVGRACDYPFARRSTALWDLRMSDASTHGADVKYS